jgi:outer membrane protein
MQRLALVFAAVAAVAAVLITVPTLAFAQGGAPPRAPAAAPVKIAFINMQEVLKRTPGYVAAESTYRKLVVSFQNELQRLQQQLDSAVQLFDQQALVLSPAARSTKQKDLQAMQQRMVQRQQVLQDSAQAREAELMEPLRLRINSVIQGIRAEQNYSLILDADAGGGFVLAADPALNITTRVLQRLTQAQ